MTLLFVMLFTFFFVLNFTLFFFHWRTFFGVIVTAFAFFEEVKKEWCGTSIRFSFGVAEDSSQTQNSEDLKIDERILK